MRKIKEILTKPLTKGSLILFMGTTIGSFGSYLYHLLMGRILGPEEYSVVSSSVSILYFLSIPTVVLTLVISKFISFYLGKGENSKISSLYLYLIKKSFPPSLIMLLFFILISPFLKDFLKFDSLSPLLAVSGAIFLSLPLSVNRGFLQGGMNFTWLALLSSLETFIKLFFSLSLVLVGLKSFGAILGYSISSFLNFAIASLPFKKYFLRPEKKEKSLDLRKMIKFSFPVLINNLSFISLYSLDIILVKHFFSSYEAGLYSSASVLGKIIFWFSSPVVTVAYPIISKRQAENKSYFSILLTAIFFVSLASGALVLIYKFFPELMINLLFGNKFIDVKFILVPFAFFIFLHTLANALINIYLSLSLTKPVIFAGLAAIFQAVLILFFHNNLFQIILISQIVCGILLASLLFYLPKIYALQRRQKK